MFLRFREMGFFFSFQFLKIEKNMIGRLSPPREPPLSLIKTLFSLVSKGEMRFVKEPSYKSAQIEVPWSLPKFPISRILLKVKGRERKLERENKQTLTHRKKM